MNSEPKPRADAAIPIEQVVAEWREWRATFPGMTPAEVKQLVTVTPPRTELTRPGPIST